MIIKFFELRNVVISWKKILKIIIDSNEFFNFSKFSISIKIFATIKLIILLFYSLLLKFFDSKFGNILEKNSKDYY